MTDQIKPETLSVEEAIEIAGGETKLTFAFNHPLEVMVARAKGSGESIDAKAFFRTLEHCQGTATANTARNKVLDDIAIREATEKAQATERARDDRDSSPF